MALSLSPGGQPGRIFWLALASGRRDRGRAAGLAHGVWSGRRSARDRSVQCGSGVRRATWAKWIKSSTRARSRTPCTSTSRGCLQVHPRGPTNRTQVRVQVSDDLTEW